MPRKKASISSTDIAISTHSKVSEKEEEDGNISDVNSESSEAQIISILQSQIQDNKIMKVDTDMKVVVNDLKKEEGEKEVEVESKGKLNSVFSNLYFYKF